MSTQITTSGQLAATGSGPGRRIDRSPDGTLWTIKYDGSAQLFYSKDNGATWTGSDSFVGCINPSIFIDLDGYLHIAFRASTANSSNGVSGSANYSNRTASGIYYMRGTPNGGNTSFTWSASFQMGQAANLDYPDLVAFRNPAGGWNAYVVISYLFSSTNQAVVAKATISAGGAITFVTGTGGFDGLPNFDGNNAELCNLSPSYGVAAHVYPSIDFNHTGDGKTVASGAPHLYVGWTAGTTGTGKGTRFRKAVYASGAWTWNAEREIDSTRANSTSATWQTLHFDGTQVVIAGHLYTGSSFDIVLHDRDAADTVTTARALITAVTAASSLISGSATYDASGNVYLFGRDGSASNGTRLVNYRKWTRAGASLGAIVTLDSTGPDTPYISAKRGYSSSRVEIVRTDYAAASPYPVVYDSITLNAAPNASTGLTPSGSTTIDLGITQRFQWAFSDPNPGDTQSKFDLQYRIGTAAWTTVTQTSTNQFYDFPAGTFTAGNYEWQVRTYDSTGTAGPWSASAFFTAASAPATPTITAPTSGSTVGGNSALVSWSEPAQDAYQVRTVGDSAGAADASTIYTDTGTVVDSSGRSRTVAFATNGVYQHVQVRVQVGGLWSAWADVRVLVSYTPPAVPTVAVATNTGTGLITLTISDPVPTGSQPAVSSHDVYRRLAGDGTAGIRLAAAIGGTSWVDFTAASRTAYEYRVVANGSNTTSTASAWSP